MPRFQGPALILKRWEVGESDLLVSFVEHGGGKRRGIAKGAKRSKKRFGGLLSPFLLVQIEYFEKPGKDLVRIEGCALIHYYSSLSTDLGKLLVGCCFLEMVERVLQEGELSSDYFELLKGSFECLDQGEDEGVLLWVFFVKCLRLLGILPELCICIHCRRPVGASGIFGFSVPQGGPVCGSCIGMGTATHRVCSDTLSFLRLWLSLPLGDPSLSGVPDRILYEAEMILDAFISYHVIREFRSLRVLKRMRSKTPTARDQEIGRRVAGR